MIKFRTGETGCVTLDPRIAGLDESELERLVRVANEGIVAAYTLIRYHKDSVERRFLSGTLNDTPFLHRADFDVGEHFVIKAKPHPLPEPIYVGGPLPGAGPSSKLWKVELSEDRKTVTVGCRQCPTDSLVASLCSLIRLNEALHGDLMATKSGPRHGVHTISWADADRLLAYLEEGLKK